ncbi:cuticle protein 19-like [Palaemon carinicauda]|uniref:cuticle protein 19-like n=1 Tax=Palaemon carinicauda TaxID=392227 RepID=UPI0035B60D47
MFKKVTLLCLVALAAARPDKLPTSGYGYSAPTPAPIYSAPQPTYEAPQPSYSAPAPTYEEPEKGMPFDFEYAVKDGYKGVDFAHDSESDGNVVKGEYRVALPDGRTQIVTYTADNYNGYQAEVTYEGEAQPYKPAPSYSAPEPVYSAPQPVYSAPEPVYSAPEPVYSAPQPVYSAPEPVYSAPEPVYSAPEPVYSAPEPVYSAPEPVYSAPEPVYSAPARTYEQPSSLYGAPRN